MARPQERAEYTYFKKKLNSGLEHTHVQLLLAYDPNSAENNDSNLRDSRLRDGELSLDSGSSVANTAESTKTRSSMVTMSTHPELSEFKQSIEGRVDASEDKELTDIRPDDTVEDEDKQTSHDISDLPQTFDAEPKMLEPSAIQWYDAPEIANSKKADATSADYDPLAGADEDPTGLGGEEMDTSNAKQRQDKDFWESIESDNKLPAITTERHHVVLSPLPDLKPVPPDWDPNELSGFPKGCSQSSLSEGPKRSTKSSKRSTKRSKRSTKRSKRSAKKRQSSAESSTNSSKTGSKRSTKGKRSKKSKGPTLSTNKKGGEVSIDSGLISPSYSPSHVGRMDNALDSYRMAMIEQERRGERAPTPPDNLPDDITVQRASRYEKVKGRKGRKKVAGGRKAGRRPAGMGSLAGLVTIRPAAIGGYSRTVMPHKMRLARDAVHWLTVIVEAFTFKLINDSAMEARGYDRNGTLKRMDLEILEGVFEWDAELDLLRDMMQIPPKIARDPARNLPETRQKYPPKTKTSSAS